MIAKAGVKVLDFGLAKSAQDETLTVANAIDGYTGLHGPGATGKAKPCDARTDIYALGLVLSEMATGKRTQPGEPPAARFGSGEARSRGGAVPGPGSRRSLAKRARREVRAGVGSKSAIGGSRRKRKAHFASVAIGGGAIHAGTGGARVFPPP